ncbi:hypothetical protein KSP39_PZI018976 [Platanthera zijinensis]|uniref:Uncharacterized protein n=1 Tax=Platanthera zijinensis TaxID=2320716 RepID=A0AAP0FZD4_9ASPA
MGSFMRETQASTCTVIRMLIMGEIQTTGSQHPVMCSHVDQQGFLDAVRSKIRCPSLLRKRSTRLRP